MTERAQSHDHLFPGMEIVTRVRATFVDRSSLHRYS